MFSADEDSSRPDILGKCLEKIHYEVPHKICSTNEYRVAPPPEPLCYTQPEVQKEDHKVCTSISTISSLEKCNRKIKLTDKAN